MALAAPSSRWLLCARDITVPDRLQPLSRAGRSIHIIGPNGAGKSMLFACRAGLQPFRGEVQMLDKPLAAWTPGALAAARAVAAIVGQLPLMPMLARPLNALSGGEWQRVRLAAVMLQVWPTLNTDALLLLLDEPAASLDIAQQVALDQLIARRG